MSTWYRILLYLGLKSTTSNFCMLYIQNNSIPNPWHYEVRQWFFHISIFRHRITFVWKKSIFLNNVQFMNGAKQMSKNYWQFKKVQKYQRNAHRIFTKAEMTHSRTQTVLLTLLTHNPIKNGEEGSMRVVATSSVLTLRNFGFFLQEKFGKSYHFGLIYKVWKNSHQLEDLHCVQMQENYFVPIATTLCL